MTPPGSRNADYLLPDAFTFCVSMEGDWHVGSGAGRPGNVDRLVARDPDDLPFVPAKTLTGIWRDACEQVAAALDTEGGKGWSDLIEAIFGEQPALRENHHRATPPGCAILSIGPARLPEPLARRLKGRHAAAVAYRQALTFLKPGVAIDAETGRAREDFYRIEEMTRRGAELAGCGTLDWRDAEAAVRRDVSALLLAGALWVDRLGGKRRRGAGRCRLSVNGIGEQATATALDHLEGKAQAPALPAKKDETDGAPVSGRASEKWKKLQIRVALESPVSVPSRVVGNVGESLPYVPGTYLLPYLTRKLGAAGLDIHPAIRRGEMRVLPLTPEIAGDRSLPAPFALAERKGAKGFEEPGSVFNLLAESPSKNIENPIKDVQIRRINDGFIALYDRGVLPGYIPAKANIVVQTHNTVTDAVQRPTEEGGGVFSYEAIASGSILRGELWLREDIYREIKPHLIESNAACRLGRSKKDDYGQCTITITADEEQNAAASEPEMACDRRLYVWCQSDVLVRSRTLGPAASIEALKEAVEDAIGGGVSLALPKPLEHGTSAAVRTRRIESWHDHWGLPRPSLIGIRAGSCAVFEVRPESLDAKVLARIEAEGLGERRAEGYGQVSFNNPVLTSAISNWKPADTQQPDADAKAPEPMRPDEPGYAIAEIIERAAWRGAITRSALAIGGSQKRREELFRWHVDERGGEPPKSQLGGLRQVIRRLEKRGDCRLVTTWLKELNEVKNRKEKWPDEAIPKVYELANTEETVWTWLRDHGLEEPVFVYPLTAGGDERLRSELWAEAVRTLFEAAFDAHARAVEARLFEGESADG